MNQTFLSPLQFRRYQLKKEAIARIKRQHPWILHKSLSSAVEAFLPNTWLKLYDGSNQVIGHGVYSPLGAIGIWVIEHQGIEPDLNFFASVIKKKLARKEIAQQKYRSNAYRLIHGEADQMPGLNIDVFDQTAVCVPYLPIWDSVLPFLENEMRSLHIADRFIIKFPKQREKLTTSIESTDEGLPFKEGDFTFYSHPKRGQKSGYYLDLRELRFWLAQQDLKNKKVLNLFANSGSLGVIAEKKGASVINVELSNKELELAKMNYEINQLTFSTENWVTLDCWDFLKNNSLKYTNEFDLIIIDPPSLTSAKKNIPQALAAWQKLHSLALPLLKSKGMMVSANCTARINALQHRQEIEKSLLRKEKKNKNFFFLPSTFDHPILINFPEGDYLKISISTFDD